MEHILGVGIEHHLPLTPAPRELEMRPVAISIESNPVYGMCGTPIYALPCIFEPAPVGVTVRVRREGVVVLRVQVPPEEGVVHLGSYGSVR